MRGATSLAKSTFFWYHYFNPHSPCGERPIKQPFPLFFPCISIHTPHAGSDIFSDQVDKFFSDFNPHSPCGERPNRSFSSSFVSLFQSTLPMRGATGSDSHSAILVLTFQSTLPMRGATLFSASLILLSFYFNPHSPCGERRYKWYIFLNTNNISIHTPHAGSDCKEYTERSRYSYFNPHSPCGERHFILPSLL